MSRLRPRKTEAEPDHAGADELPESTPKTQDLPPPLTPDTWSLATDARRLAGWARKGGLAVLDQGLFAGSNFLVNILLARWLLPEEYGAFVVAYSIVLLISVAQSAFLYEPMLIYGSKYTDDLELAKYLLSIIGVYWVAALILSFVVATVAVALVSTALESDMLAQTILTISFVMPFILFYWLLRRAYYLRVQLKWPMVAGILYLVLVSTGLFALHKYQLLTSSSSLLVLGSISGINATLLLIMLQLPWKKAIIQISFSQGNIANAWNYGKWIMGSQVSLWIISNVPYVLLASSSLNSTGVLRALLNLFVPFQNLLIGLANLWLSIMPREYRASGIQGFIKKTITINAVFLVPISLLYAIIVAHFRNQILLILYGGQYLEYADHLQWGIMLPLLWVGWSVLGISARAMNMPKEVFRGSLWAVLVFSLVGIPLTALLNVKGALISISISLSAYVMYMIRIHLRVYNQD